MADAVSEPAKRALRVLALIGVALIASALIGLAGGEARASEGAPTRDYWLLTEFDWGDDPEVVYDSLEVAPGFVCFDAGNECRLVRVRVDGEDLLARFDYRDDRLWQIRFVTPELGRRQARDHMPRVLGLLARYIERFKGPPLLASRLPLLNSVVEGSPRPTHFWKLPDMEIRIEVGRRGEKFYIGAVFYDPHSAADETR
jgi:hypothetical protein